MTLNDYQETAYTFAVYEDELYPVVGLQEEVGEVSRLFAKVLREDPKYLVKTADGESRVSQEFDELLFKELGDVLWMVAAIAKDSGFDLDDIARENINKLTNRKVRGIIKGDGDNR